MDVDFAAPRVVRVVAVLRAEDVDFAAVFVPRVVAAFRAGAFVARVVLAAVLRAGVLAADRVVFAAAFPRAAGFFAAVLAVLLRVVAPRALVPRPPVLRVVVRIARGWADVLLGVSSVLTCSGSFQH
ncbi:MAG: hypothetical protein JOY70_08640 [Acidisphaera sp.]|nr:hypothetical protein [Acidisphaera sp.]